MESPCPVAAVARLPRMAAAASVLDATSAFCTTSACVHPIRPSRSTARRALPAILPRPRCLAVSPNPFPRLLDWSKPCSEFAYGRFLNINNPAVKKASGFKCRVVWVWVKWRPLPNSFTRMIPQIEPTRSESVSACACVEGWKSLHDPLHNMKCVSQWCRIQETVHEAQGVSSECTLTQSLDHEGGTA